MIVPDTNLLVYAYNDGSPYYDAARGWWEELTNGSESVGLSWVVAVGFVRLMTNPSVIEYPLSPREAIGLVRDWFERPHITFINPSADHLDLFLQNMEDAGMGGNLTPDAHIAALAMEYGAEVHSNDADFGRFPGLRWRNPLGDG